MQYFRKLQLPIMLMFMICLLFPQSGLVADDCGPRQCPEFYYPVDYSKCSSSCFDYGTITCIVVGALAGAGAGYAAGDNHHSGHDGKKGTQGSTGPKGDTGITGPQGLTGATGAQGQTGTKGDQGSTGVTGSQGATGAAGTDGAQGATGPQGPSGPAGSSCGGCGSCPGGDTDEGQTLTFTFTYDIVTTNAPNSTLTPFVVTPSGSIIQDSDFTITTVAAAAETRTIVVSSPAYGTYLVGYNIVYPSVELAFMELTTTVLASTDSSTTTLHDSTTPTGPSTGQIQLAENYIYSSTISIP